MHKFHNLHKALDDSMDQLGQSDWYSVLHYGRFLQVLTWLTSRATQGASGLEVGVWPGYMGVALKVLGYKLTGIDINPGRMKDLALPIIKLDLNSEPLPFPDQSLDFINCSEVIEHLNPKAVAMFFREANRILKPGGVFIVTTPNKWRLGVLFQRHKTRLDNHGHGHELEYSLNQISHILIHEKFKIEEAGTISFYSNVGKIAHDKYFYPLWHLLRFPNKKRNLFKLFLYPIIKFVPQLRDSIYFIARKQ